MAKPDNYHEIYKRNNGRKPSLGRWLVQTLGRALASLRILGQAVPKGPDRELLERKARNRLLDGVHHRAATDISDEDPGRGSH